jgi:hypothetical protein
MKSVLRTRDRHTERNVAMAVLREPSVCGKQAARFVREAKGNGASSDPGMD